MRAIETTGMVSHDGTMTIDLSGEVRPGRHRVVVVIEELTSDDLVAVAQYGGAFDWLRDEPDLYTEEDGEPFLDSSASTRSSGRIGKT